MSTTGGTQDGSAEAPARLAAAAAARYEGLEVSVCCGRLGAPPAVTHQADRPHYAASMIKLAVLLAAHRAGALDRAVTVREEFASAVGGTYRADRAYDNDDEPWHHLGGEMTLRRLCHRMICSSSNLATSVVVEHLGLGQVAAACPEGLVVQRPIGDRAAAEAGLTNTVTARAAVQVMQALLDTGDPRLLRPLREQRYTQEIPAALPPGTPVANKNGWVTGVLHDVALVEPPEAPPYLLAVCVAGGPEESARSAIHRVAEAGWLDRQRLGQVAPGAGTTGAGPAEADPRGAAAPGAAAPEGEE
ncbi:serine hydrolase [Streptomyces diacarni]|uniref:Serine hydrolase n=1 Tax=Streptomyces diacarni TaxID=2800381 RepID=A0A367EU90_9ACTN|nr:serine hydrolase [Streptomyces diacarni]RCG21242.1 serine hydrolase [Streptomyces diacarni]